jgi:penicillin amidase
MQLTSPTVNVYGATFPGSPNVIIGFNDQVAFGFTNAMRDVKDYYQVKFRDESKNAYLFNGEWKPTRLRVEAIKVRGAATFYDTVAYTHFGPVMYDQSFTTDSTSNTAIAVRWIAHDPSNEGAMWMKLNRAKDYDDYLAAIKDYQCPAQNMLFASKAGDIALWQQGKFPARWWGQGMYVMPGTDSSYQWQGYIPQEQNPHTLNPVEGFIQSANQRPVDSAYPYYIPGNYIVPRGITIERRLQQMQRITPMDMMRLQNDYFLSTAEDALPLLFRHTAGQSLNAGEQAYLDTLRGWDLRATPHSRAMTIYQAWFDTLENIVWNDEFSRVKGDVTRPDEQTLLEGLLRDSAFRFADNIETPQKETPGQQVVEAFRRASAALQKEESENGLVWFRHKNVSIYHLLRTSVLPFARRGLEAGGSGHTINAITTTHGPSWRMVVHLTPTTEAYGIYPGGQSGNPGSRFYDNFVDAWARGEYHTLWMMKESESKDKRIIGTIRFTNS